MALAIKKTRVVDVPVTTLRACMDMACIATLLDAEGVVVGQSTTPSWLPQVLQIDLESGRIVNWRAPTVEQLQAMADGQSAAVATPEPERPYTILDLMRDNSPETYEAEMRRRAGEPDLHPVTTTHESLQPVDVVAPEPKRRCPISGQLIPFEYASIEVMPDTVAVLDKYMPQMTNLVDVSHSVGATPEVTQPVDVVAPVPVVAVENVPEGHQPKTPEIDTMLRQDGQGRLYLATAPVDQQPKTPEPVAHKPELWGVFIDNGCGTCQAAHSFDLATAYCELLQKVRPDYVGLVSVKPWPEGEIHDPEWFDESYQSCLKSAEQMQAAEAEPVVALHPTTPIEYDHCAVTERGPAKPRYRNPATGETWTGRGKQPMWLQAAIADGGAPDDFLVDAQVDIEEAIEAVEQKEASLPVAVLTQAGTKWVAVCGEYKATSSVSKFSAVTLLAERMGLGECEIKKIESQVDIAAGQLRYTLDNSRTQNTVSAFVTFRPASEYTARTVGPQGKRATSTSGMRQAISNLIKKLGYHDNDLIIATETTDDAMRADSRVRYSLDCRNATPLTPDADEEVVEEVEVVTEMSAPATYEDVVMAINHAQTVAQATALVDRISKHANFAQQQSLYGLQRKRIDAIKAASQST